MQSSAGQARRRFQMWNLGGEQPEASGKAPEGDVELAAPAEAAADAHHHAAAAADTSPAARAADSNDDAVACFVQALGEAPQKIELDGLCELPSGVDRSCRTKTIGPQSLNVVYQDALDKSDKRRHLDDGMLSGTVHIDLDEVGKFHGVLTAQTVEGFDVTVDPKFNGLLMAKLAHYMARGLPQQQEHRGGVGVLMPSDRIVPKSAFCTYRDQHGVLYKGSLINISRVDAMVKARTLPELNSLITFCGRRQRRAHVIRRFETGFSALFVDPLVDQEFSADIRLTDEFPGYPG
jgi:hypothetical protein